MQSDHVLARGPDSRWIKIESLIHRTPQRIGKPVPLWRTSAARPAPNGVRDLVFQRKQWDFFAACGQ